MNITRIENGEIVELSQNILFNITGDFDEYVFDTFAFGGDMFFCKKYFVEIKNITNFNGSLRADVSLLDEDDNELVYTPNYFIRNGVFWEN